MSGILNSKERVIDLLVTQEGRRQISNGQLKIEHISFSDDDTFYKADLLSGSEDTRNRIFFEVGNLPQDCITFESNDSGRLKPFNNNDNLTLLNGQVLSGTYIENTSDVLSGTLLEQNTVFGTRFSSIANEILDASLNNFNYLRLLGTFETLEANNLFRVSTNQINFDVTSKNYETSETLNVKSADSLLSDPRLSSQINFKFLPPINKKSNVNEAKKELGSYKKWQTKPPITSEELLKRLSNSKYHKKIKFSNTSSKNNILSQMFEISSGEVKKLDIIDFGKHPVIVDGFIVWNHIFFVGKIFVDDECNDTYINLFTLVFS